MPGTNDFLSKPLVALKQGKNCGIITNVMFDDKLQKATGLLLFDRLDGSYHCVAMEKAQKTQGDAVMIDDADDVAPFDGEVVNPVNFDVFDANGAHLGVISEVVFSKDLQVRYLLCRDRKITPDKVLARSNGTMVIKAAPKLRPRPKMQPQPTPQKPPARPNIGAGSFMLGRRCDKTLLNRFNEVIIRQNGVITADVIRQAKLNGKLLELSMHAVTDK